MVKESRADRELDGDEIGSFVKAMSHCASNRGEVTLAVTATHSNQCAWGKGCPPVAS